MYATTARTSAILTAPFFDPFLCGSLLVGTGTSKKSHGFDGLRSPPCSGFEPNSSASVHPSPSESWPLDGVDVAAGVFVLVGTAVFVAVSVGVLVGVRVAVATGSGVFVAVRVGVL